MQDTLNRTCMSLNGKAGWHLMYHLSQAFLIKIIYKAFIASGFRTNSLLELFIYNDKKDVDWFTAFLEAFRGKTAAAVTFIFFKKRR